MNAWIWAFANEQASVHIGLNGQEVGTIRDAPSDTSYNNLYGSLTWEWRFRYDPGTTFDSLGFVLNAGFLEHRIYAVAGDNLDDDPITSSEFEIGIYYDWSWDDVFSSGTSKYFIHVPVDHFSSKGLVGGFVNVRPSRGHLVCEAWECKENDPDDPVWGTPPSFTDGLIRWDSNRYRGTLSPADLMDGEEGLVQYKLKVDGIGATDGRGSKILLSDPLDPNNPDEPFDPANPANSPIIEADGLIPDDEDVQAGCNDIPAADRFDYQSDGVVLDLYTGLAWQRCPLGYDFVNDACVASGSVDPVDWPDALTAANADALGGFSDWQLPNVKQLDSIVQACQPAMIAYNAFPDTPPAPFWSSTPTRSGGAWTVDFANGALQTQTTTSTALVRLMRVSDTAPIRPRPALRAAFGRALETDASTGAVVRMPILLNRAADADVTVDYTVTSGSAMVGEDFVGTSGTATLPAGTLRTTIDVNIIGDLVGEAHEYFLLTLDNPSSNVVMAQHVSLGRVVDDDRVYVGAPQVTLQLDEGNAGAAQTLQVPVVLSAPAKSTVTVNYITRDDSALAGTHYLGERGTLTFLPGEREQFISLTSIDNATVNDDTLLYIDLDGVTGSGFLDGFDSMAISVRIVDDEVSAMGTGLNDTGPAECGDACPALDGLDASTGRDATTPDDSDGIAGFSFTKLDAAGLPLADQGALYGNTPWDCVRDEVTGLMWEVKTVRDPVTGADNLRIGGSTFTWYSTAGVKTNGIIGTENGGTCDGDTDCDTEKFVDYVNSINLCGFADWRLPTIDELANIVYDGGPFFGPTLDTDYFPNQEIGASNFVRGTWTGSPDIALDDFLYGYNSLGITRFRAGPSPFGGSASRRFVRLVRGNP
ncbi:MAG: DUF1566 domain-containing protein [Pseudomonadota bacterium]